MRDLNYDFKQLCRRNRDGSYATQADREHILDLCADQLHSPYTQMSVRLADGFGLRREACIKMVPGKADQGDVLVLKASWNKGGSEIRVPIRTPEQRQLLEEAKALAKGKSLVAAGYRTYYAYLKHFRAECERVGINGVHGYRHRYAQRRYHELTGWECPARGR